MKCGRAVQAQSDGFFQALVNYTRTDIKSLHISTGHSHQKCLSTGQSHQDINSENLLKAKRIWVPFSGGGTGKWMTSAIKAVDGTSLSTQGPRVGQEYELALLPLQTWTSRTSLSQNHKAEAASKPLLPCFFLVFSPTRTLYPLPTLPTTHYPLCHSLIKASCRETVSVSNLQLKRKFKSASCHHAIMPSYPHSWNGKDFAFFYIENLHLKNYVSLCLKLFNSLLVREPSVVSSKSLIEFTRVWMICQTSLLSFNSIVNNDHSRLVCLQVSGKSHALTFQECLHIIRSSLHQISVIISI